MQTKIIPLPTRRRKPDRAAYAALAAELRQVRLELAELREIIRAMTPPAPGGLGGRP
jgi:hypothetical protein